MLVWFCMPADLFVNTHNWVHIILNMLFMASLVFLLVPLVTFSVLQFDIVYTHLSQTSIKHYYILNVHLYSKIINEIVDDIYFYTKVERK